MAGILLFLAFTSAQSLQIDNHDDILESSKALAHDLIGYYKGNQTGQIPGLLPPKAIDSKNDIGYLWYQSGIFMSTYVDYWYLTGDETYNDLVLQGMTHQSEENFMPMNQTTSLGNDDQSVWASAALTAAEHGFSEHSNETSWEDLAIQVFEDQRLRWDAEVRGDIEDEDNTCNGGLRWQIWQFNVGYDFKQSKSTEYVLVEGLIADI